ncbi:hypothetical protein R80B4_00256 [Fibrobacteres bacterium R8-0-B4]
MSLSIRRCLKLVGLMTVPAVLIVAFAVSGQEVDTVAAIEIATFEELCKIGVEEGYPLSGDYALTADIDASGSRDLNDGAGFLPIGWRKVSVPSTGFGVPDVVDSSKAFTGTFDGGGYTVSGLYIKRTVPNEASGAGINIGLFGFAIGAHIMNVTVAADSVVGYSGVGALVGRLSGGVVENSVSAGVVVGQTAVGGLVGMLDVGGTVRVCYSSADVGGESVTDAGGLVGSSDAVISESYSVGRVNVGGGERVGGLAGSLTNRAEVLSCYSFAAVSGGEAAKVGGLIGKVDDGGKVRRSYSVGAVSGVGAGGLIGEDGGTAALYSFWDTERSGCAVSAGGAGGAGRTTAQMMSASAMNSLVTADAASWGISNNYPYLKNDFFPKRTMTVTAARGGALSGDTAADGTHTQRVNHWIDGKTVAATPSPDSIVGNFEGWYLAGSDTALAAGLYAGFSVADAQASADGMSGTLLLSELTTDIAVEARFAAKIYTLRYIAGSGRGKVESLDDNAGESVADTLVKLVKHGDVSSVQAVPNAGRLFLTWSKNWNNEAITTPTRTDTALSNATYIAYFKTDSVTLIYTADTNGKLRVGAAAPVQTHTAKPLYGSNGPRVEAVPNANYHFVKWSDNVTTNPRIDSTVAENVDVLAIFSNTYNVTYIAGAGGKIAVRNVGADTLSEPADTATVTVTVSVPLTPAASAIAVADSGYAFVRWSDGVTDSIRNDASARKDSVVTAIFDTIPVAVKSPDRIVPNGQLTSAAAQIQPVNKTMSGGLTAGPNPVLIQNGKVSLFWQGSKITAGTLLIFDANGNFVDKIIVNDNNNSIDKRTIATWNLTDAKGNPVGVGTYLIKGTISAKNGKRENVALILQLF